MFEVFQRLEGDLTYDGILDIHEMIVMFDCVYEIICIN